MFVCVCTRTRLSGSSDSKEFHSYVCLCMCVCVCTCTRLSGSSDSRESDSYVCVYVCVCMYTYPAKRVIRLERVLIGRCSKLLSRLPKHIQSSHILCGHCSSHIRSFKCENQGPTLANPHRIVRMMLRRLPENV